MEPLNRDHLLFLPFDSVESVARLQQQEAGARVKGCVMVIFADTSLPT